MTSPRYSAATLAALAAWEEAWHATAGRWWGQCDDAAELGRLTGVEITAWKAFCDALDADRARRESAMRAAEDEALARLADRTTALAEAMERDRAQPHRHQYGEPL